MTIDESEIKRKIMDNYGFVDTENDRKYHRPRVNRKGVRSWMVLEANTIPFCSKKRRR